MYSFSNRLCSHHPWSLHNLCFTSIVLLGIVPRKDFAKGSKPPDRRADFPSRDDPNGLANDTATRIATVNLEVTLSQMPADCKAGDVILRRYLHRCKFSRTAFVVIALRECCLLFPTVFNRYHVSRTQPSSYRLGGNVCGISQCAEQYNGLQGIDGPRTYRGQSTLWSRKPQP